MKPEIYNKLKRFRKILIYSKIWISRTMSWINMLNSGMILFLVLSKLQEYGIKIHITRWFIPLYAVVICLLITIGYIDDKVGFYREESRTQTQRNPYFAEIINKLDNIEERLKKIENRK